MGAAANIAFVMYQALTHGAYTAIHAHGSRRAEGDLPAEARDLRVDRHDEPDRAARRHRPRPAAHQGRAAARRQLPRHRAEDLHLRRRPRPRRQHRPPRPRPHPRRPGRVKGISLLIVPKFLPNPDGSLGARNAVSVGKLEEKMGIHGNATCVMNYDGATGYLIGEPHRGLQAMFTMMNEARIGVGLQGLAQGEAAYQLAATYARERLQGRAVAGARQPRRRRRPADRPPRRAADADGPEGLRRGRPRLPLLGRDARRRPRARRRRRGARPRLAADPGGEGLPDRQGLRGRGRGAADLRRPRLHRGDRHRPVRPRRPHRR